MASVTLEKLRREFPNGAVAVDDIDLDIADGEFVSLLGASGCGKSTTLRMIAGLEHPSAGRILFDGKYVNAMSPAARNVAMVFQSYALYPHMTVAGNLAYPLRKRGVPTRERDAKVAEMASLLQIGALLDRKPRQLSGGQQQRVALGRALIRDPDVFLLDEPLSNLDAKLRAHMRSELIQLHRRTGTTIIYVTHDQLEAMTMSDRIAVLEAGRLQQVGTPDEIYTRPANRSVAAFVGTPTMNFLEAILGPQPGTLHLADGLSLAVTGAGWNAPAGAPVTLGVRPEDVVIGGDALPAVVSLVEPTGHETLVIFACAGVDIAARTRPSTSLRAGDRVSLGFDRTRLHLFDGMTGLRLAPTAPLQPTEVHSWT